MPGRRQTVAAMELPDTTYVTVGDAEVAYQVIGEGPRDLFFAILSADTSISFGRHRSQQGS